MRAFWLSLILCVAALPARADLERHKTDCLTGTGVDAVRACTWLLQNWPTTRRNRSAIYSNRGVAYALAGRHNYALQNFNLALRLNPRDAKTHFNRGKTFVAYRNYPAALRDFNRALSLDPDHVGARINRGVVYAAIRQYARAIREFDLALRREPRNVNALVNRGLAHERRGDRPAAVEDYREALRLDPGDDRARTGLRRLGARP